MFKRYRSVFIVLFIAWTFFSGVFVGRLFVDEKVKIEYVTLEPVYGSISTPKPTLEQIPDNPNYIFKDVIRYKDSIQYVEQVIDTMAILHDWIIKRTYDLEVFDIDTVGKLKVNLAVQYNKLDDFNYEYTPIQKVITKTRKNKFDYYLGVGFNNINQFGLRGGAFINNIGAQLEYNKDLKGSDNSYGFALLYKFK